MGRIVVGILVMVLGWAAWAGPASAIEDVPPVSADILTSQSPVSWAPGRTEFEYRVNFRSGPSGADFSFSVKEPYWGFDDGSTSGSPFHLGRLSLEGPGLLKATASSHGDPAPWSCFRGAWGNYENWYSLKMTPDSSTTVIVPASLGSAPLAGMDAATVLTIGNPLAEGGAEKIPAAAPRITGKPGVRIISHVVGGLDTARQTTDQYFRLAGFTRPAIANRKLVLSTQSRTGGFGRPPLGLVRLGTVRTDARGRFRSRPFRIDQPGPWLTMARPTKPSRFVIEHSCGPVLDLKEAGSHHPATLRDLDGRSFVSTSIRGPGAKPKKIRMDFVRGVIYGDHGEVIDQHGPIMVVRPGCNSIAAAYRVRKGRLRWISPVVSTMVGCTPDRDPWLSMRLRGGMKASINGNALVLRGKRGVRIRLKASG